MNYEKAKAIAAQHAPDLLLDDDAGHPHVVVRKTKEGRGHSIMLPLSLFMPPIEACDATPEIPATADATAQPARAAVVARSSAEQMMEAERKAFTDALDAAIRYL